MVIHDVKHPTESIIAMLAESLKKIEILQNVSITKLTSQINNVLIKV